MCIFASTILLVRGCIVGHVRCPVHLVTLSCSVLNWISLCYADCTCLFFGVKWLFCCLSYSKESHNFSLQLLTSPAALTYQVCPGILFSFSFFQISMIFKWISLTSGQLLKPDLEKKKNLNGILPFCLGMLYLDYFHLFRYFLMHYIVVKYGRKQRAMLL